MKQSALAHLRTEALPEVDGEGGAHRVDVAGNGAHGGCKDGGYQQARHALRHLTHHEEGQNGVALVRLYVELVGMGLIESVKSGSDEVEHDAHKNAHHAVGQNAVARTLHILGGQIALNHRLVAGVADQVVRRAANDGYPKGDTSIIQTPLEHAHLVVLPGNLQGMAETARGVAQQPGCDVEGAAHEDATLYDVAPNDRLHAAHGAVHNCNDAHQHNARAYVDARHGGQGERGQIENQRHAGYHEHDEKSARHQSRGKIEAVLEIFVG